MNPRHLITLALIVSLAATMGCEGDQGRVGPPGVDSTASCLTCHASSAQAATSSQYVRSGHAVGAYVDYAGGRASCARCHSGGGFVEFVANGSVDGNIATPVAIGCEHCHAVHTSFESSDYALRSTGPVPIIADAGVGDTSFDFGTNANLCSNCHQTRRAEPNIASPGATFEITSTHYGPHHGPQANVLNGTNFAEIPGPTSYPIISIHLILEADCLTCHMGTYTDQEGGHTWKTSLASCQGCHPTTDFDYNGFQTTVQGQLDDLRDLLIAEGAVEWVVDDEAYEPVKGTYDMVVVQGFFNWIGLEEDRSLGTHNPRYFEALLGNSIAALEARVAP